MPIENTTSIISLVGGGSQERQSVCYIYDIIIFPVGFSFVLSPNQYHNALQETQIRYCLFKKLNNLMKIKGGYFPN